MQKFENRRDRFNFFNSFENPLLNLTFRFETVNFLPYCKAKNIPPFHFFLYHLFQALQASDNFRYRWYQNEVIKVDEIISSYTVLGEDHLFNYTRFEFSYDQEEFIQRSLKARDEALQSYGLINTGVELAERDLKNYVFITSIPWLDFTSIQHPVYKFKSADIPAVAWGKFNVKGDVLEMPLSVQAHHGFVDAFHIHQLAEDIKERLKKSVQA